MTADDGAGFEEVPGDGSALAALAARVAALERQVAELSGAHPLTVAQQARPGLRAKAAEYVAVGAAMTPPPPPPRMDSIHAELDAAVQEAPRRPAAAAPSLESRLGSQVFNMIGIVAILAGASYGLKLAIDRGWLGPLARVVIGLVAGAALVLWSELFRRKGLEAFSYSLKAVGSSVLYLSLWAGFQLYHLMPAEVALTAMILVTAWNGFMAWSQDAELLAAYGLVGGFATPLLLSTGGNHETFLFLYIGAIDLATVLLMRWKPWRRLLVPAFAATALYFIGWYSEWFHRGGVNVVDGDTYETAWFALMFALIFAVVSVRGFRRDEVAKGEIVTPVLIPLANAAFLSLALYSVMQDSGLHEALAWLMVALAAIYLLLMRVQAAAISKAIHLACAVIFLTIAIPLKASGHTLTTAWLVEGLVLYWVATRFEAGSTPPETMEPSEMGHPKTDRAPGRVLWGLSLAGYGLGLLSLAFHWLWSSGIYDFFNADLGSSLVAVATLGGAAWLAVREAGPNAGEEPVTLFAALAAIDLVALLLTSREIAVSEFYHYPHRAFANAEFATALVGLAILAAVSWIAYRLARRPVFGACAAIAGVTLVLFNLAAILSVEREIGALWTRSEANLQRSLAISAFLMAYGAVLLAAGFWRRSAFVRWQALVLLLFTICKVFFYDISGLSEGYRVASFLGLGAVLMGVSFAYQKDWLGLRGTAATATPEPEPVTQGGER